MKRTKCKACLIIANDIDSAKKIINKNTSLKEHLEGEFCNNLGYNHNPYTW